MPELRGSTVRGHSGALFAKGPVPRTYLKSGLFEPFGHLNFFWGNNS
ncbi:hypothetical protein Trco_000602 [Trichoderma cornu-damae]|uniref:Uncharacterized protein n=1 Tax=Trichoderma cornu-damae TaxID=654480 RepID=A0A9P8TZZ8_9HYPO|nr:hypothetical protein Trco_000602 [Trichoderma cornu-damae]